MKNLLISLLLSLFIPSIFAQPSSDIAPIKDGDNVVYKYIVYGEKGRDIVEASSNDLPATVLFSGTGYSVKYRAGRVESYSSQHVQLTVLSRGKLTVYSPEEQFQWFPKDFSAGKKDPVAYDVQSTECSKVKNTFPDVTVEPGTRNLKIQGVEKQVPVQIISYKGKWSGSCGSGNFVNVIVFSQELNFVVERKSLNYLPNGFLYQGEGRILHTLN